MNFLSKWHCILKYYARRKQEEKLMREWLSVGHIILLSSIYTNKIQSIYKRNHTTWVQIFVLISSCIVWEMQPGRLNLGSQASLRQLALNCLLQSLKLSVPSSTNSKQHQAPRRHYSLGYHRQY